MSFFICGKTRIPSILYYNSQTRHLTCFRALSTEGFKHIETSYIGIGIVCNVKLLRGKKLSKHAETMNNMVQKNSHSYNSRLLIGTNSLVSLHFVSKGKKIEYTRLIQLIGSYVLVLVRQTVLLSSLTYFSNANAMSLNPFCVTEFLSQ